jgi:hypothetical protein
MYKETQDYMLMAGINLLAQLPILILCVIGIILAIKHWADYQKASLLASIGFVALILQTIIFSILNISLPQFLMQNGTSASEMGIYFSIFGLFKSVLNAASWGLVVAAIFTQRYKK